MELEYSTLKVKTIKQVLIKRLSCKNWLSKDALDTSISISENRGTNVYYDYTLNTNSGTRDFKNQLINWLGSYQLNSNIKVNARYSNIKT